MVNTGPTPAARAAAAISLMTGGASSGTSTGRLLLRKWGLRAEYAETCSHIDRAAARHSSKKSGGAFTRSTMSWTWTLKTCVRFLNSGTPSSLGIRDPGGPRSAGSYTTDVVLLDAGQPSTAAVPSRAPERGARGPRP